MKKFLKFLFIAFVAIMLLGYFYGQSDEYQAQLKAEEAKANLTPEQKDSLAKVDLAAEIAERKESTVTAAQLVSIYSNNEVKADTELKGKTFWVEGRIESISKDILDDIYITLKTNDIVRTVQCYIDDESVVANLNKNEKVVIEGTCDGLMMNVIMKDCKVVPSLKDLENKLRY